MSYTHTTADCHEHHDLVVNFGSEPKPKIITLCGSTRFKDKINEVNANLTMCGNLVISLGVFGHTDMPAMDWETDGTSLKIGLDRLHRQKIDLADEVYVVNVGGYVGESTRREIEYATKLGKPVRYLEDISDDD